MKSRSSVDLFSPVEGFWSRNPLGQLAFQHLQDLSGRVSIPGNPMNPGTLPFHPAEPGFLPFSKLVDGAV
jgi:hypothetical protein